MVSRIVQKRKVTISDENSEAYESLESDEKELDNGNKSDHTFFVPPKTMTDIISRGRTKVPCFCTSSSAL